MIRNTNINININSTLDEYTRYVECNNNTTYIRVKSNIVSSRKEPHYHVKCVTTRQTRYRKWYHRSWLMDFTVWRAAREEARRSTFVVFFLFDIRPTYDSKQEGNASSMCCWYVYLSTAQTSDRNHFASIRSTSYDEYEYNTKYSRNMICSTTIILPYYYCCTVALDNAVCGIVTLYMYVLSSHY